VAFRRVELHNMHNVDANQWCICTWAINENCKREEHKPLCAINKFRLHDERQELIKPTKYNGLLFSLQSHSATYVWISGIIVHNTLYIYTDDIYSVDLLAFWNCSGLLSEDRKAFNCSSQVRTHCLQIGPACRNSGTTVTAHRQSTALNVSARTDSHDFKWVLN
jgi:hypothetical protein